jgi:cold shock CspA family protein
MRGTMIWFNPDKDHGYISTDEGERLFIQGAGFAGGKRLKGRCGGTPVEFEITENVEGREAMECVVVEEVAPRRARRHHSSHRF